MPTDKKKEIAKLKIEAYDLMKKVYASVSETNKLQTELSRLESEIAKLENL